MAAGFDECQRSKEKDSVVDVKIPLEAGGGNGSDAFIEAITSESESGQDLFIRGSTVRRPADHELYELTVEYVDRLDRHRLVLV